MSCHVSEQRVEDPLSSRFCRNCGASPEFIEWAPLVAMTISGEGGFLQDTMAMDDVINPTQVDGCMHFSPQEVLIRHRPKVVEIVEIFASIEVV